jgi:hypothetical protein
MISHALETVWQGYRFRSRLEARWAIFFSRLGIEFDYEPQGFSLPSGCYLPDFWLPQVHMWAEVKPGRFTQREQKLCEELVLTTGHPVLMLVGPPNFREYHALCPGFDGEGPAPEGEVWLLDYLLSNRYLHENRFFSAPGLLIRPDFDHMPEYIEAVSAARAARFEKF